MRAPLPVPLGDGVKSRDTPNRSLLRLLVALPVRRDTAKLLRLMTREQGGVDLRTVADANALLMALDRYQADCIAVDAVFPDFEDGKLVQNLRSLGIATPLVVIGEKSPGTDPNDAAVWIPRSAVSSRSLRAALDQAMAKKAAKSPGAAKPSEAGTERAERASALGDPSTSDPLTGLMDRNAFLDRLRRALAQARPGGESVGLILIDIDDFNAVNRNYGHDVGDQVLILAAARLKAESAGHVLARIGDDEFAMLLEGNPTIEGTVEFANRVRTAFAPSFRVDSRQFGILAAVGAALSPQHGETPEALLRSAAFAIDIAKRDNVSVAVFSEEHREDEHNRLALAQDILVAIEQNQLEAHYQPKINLTQRRVVGVETLLRWRHPRFGMISPEVFIPLAEQTGVIDTLTYWVLHAALAQARAWQEQGLDLTVSVNLSPAILHNLHFPATVFAALRRWKVDPHKLIFELTENAIVLEGERASDVVHQMHHMGALVSIDDFGTGYTSLAYLRRLPINEIKIDKSFVQHMRKNPDDAVIVRTIIELGHSLGLQVVAEGVEDAATFDLLCAFNCELAQGFYMGRPCAIDALKTWLETSPFSGTAEKSAHDLPLQTDGST